MRVKRTWEQKFGYVLLGFWTAVALVILTHWWQESRGEDGAVIWSCHTMGHRDCGPGSPWHGITIHWGER